MLSGLHPGHSFCGIYCVHMGPACMATPILICACLFDTLLTTLTLSISNLFLNSSYIKSFTDILTIWAGFGFL